MTYQVWADAMFEAWRNDDHLALFQLQQMKDNGEVSDPVVVERVIDPTTFLRHAEKHVMAEDFWRGWNRFDAYKILFEAEMAVVGR